MASFDLSNIKYFINLRYGMACANIISSVIGLLIGEKVPIILSLLMSVVDLFYYNELVLAIDNFETIYNSLLKHHIVEETTSEEYYSDRAIFGSDETQSEEDYNDTYTDNDLSENHNFDETQSEEDYNDTYTDNDLSENHNFDETQSEEDYNDEYTDNDLFEDRCFEETQSEEDYNDINSDNDLFEDRCFEETQSEEKMIQQARDEVIDKLSKLIKQIEFASSEDEETNPIPILIHRK